MQDGSCPTIVVFDLGGVLIDWDPRYLYRQLFDDSDEMEAFLTDVTTAEWNAHQDAGRPWGVAVELLASEHPELPGSSRPSTVGAELRESRLRP